MYRGWCKYHDMKSKRFEINVARNIVCEKNFNMRGCR